MGKETITAVSRPDWRICWDTVLGATPTRVIVTGAELVEMASSHGTKRSRLAGLAAGPDIQEIRSMRIQRRWAGTIGGLLLLGCEINFEARVVSQLPACVFCGTLITVSLPGSLARATKVKVRVQGQCNPSQYNPSQRSRATS